MVDNIDDNAEFDALVQQDATAQDAVNSPNPVQWMPNLPIKANAAIKRTRQMMFLEAFKECGTITKACKAAKINASTVRKWNDTPDQWWREQFKNALQAFRDSIQDDIHEWATKGTTEPIIGKVQTPLGAEDQIIGYKQSRNALITMFNAKRHIPEFREDYKSKEDEKPQQAESPMARITIRLDMMANRQKVSVPLEAQNVIDITPEMPEDPLQLSESNDIDA